MTPSLGWMLLNGELDSVDKFKSHSQFVNSTTESQLHECDKIQYEMIAYVHPILIQLGTSDPSMMQRKL